jgi:hypothetical protein
LSRNYLDVVRGSGYGGSNKKMIGQVVKGRCGLMIGLRAGVFVLAEFLQHKFRIIKRKCLGIIQAEENVT